MHVPTREELRARRQALGLTQAEVATMAGISQPMIARIEVGSITPSVPVLTSIVTALNNAWMTEDHAFNGW